MPGLPCYATYPGAAGVVRASYTASHGVAPGSAVVECSPQGSNPARLGTLRFVHGKVAIDLPDCRLVEASVRRDGNLFVLALTLVDRRWRWAFGAISGSYNSRDPATGQLIPDLARTPQQLASLLFDAMGEPQYDVSALPNDSVIETAWDYANPAQELASLAESLGCRVVLGQRGVPALVVPGVGAALAPGAVIEQGNTVEVSDNPDSLLLVGGPIRWQLGFDLVPVGLDVDGKILPIDKLSYRPPGGWETQTPGAFGGVSDQPLASNVVPRDLAKETVWRWYKIQLANPDGSRPLRVPRYRGKINVLKQFDLEDVQVETTVDADGTLKPLPAEVRGVYAKDELDMRNTAPDTPYTRGFSIDKVERLVKFGGPVYRRTANGYGPASIHLTTACTIRARDSLAVTRYEKSFQFNQRGGSGPKVLRHDEIQLQVVQRYDGKGKPTTSVDNLRKPIPPANDPRFRSKVPGVDAEAGYYLNANAVPYQNHKGLTLTYAGIVPVNLDGATRQVTWSVGSPHGFTRVGVNTEYSQSVPPYRTRRQVEEFRIDDFRRLKRFAEEQTRPK